MTTTTTGPAAGEARGADLERAIATLQDRKDAWARLGIAAKLGYLRELRERIGRVAGRWVATATAAKGIPVGSPLAGEEWLSGPWALLYALKQYARTLGAVANGGTPALPPGAVRARADGQVVVEVFPGDRYDRTLLNGFAGEVWLEPGLRAGGLPGAMAGFYRRRSPAGRVALVLGAGNIAGIPPLDVLHKLLAEGQVCLLKLNPVSAYLGSVFAEVFAPLIADGFVRIVGGGAEVGAALCAHAGIDEIHVTGAAATHDAIVFGPGPAGAARKRRGTPLLTKRVTSELGNVSPTIVVPGPWTAADLRFQAAQIASQKWHNAGCNCVAAQVLVLPEGWAGAPALLDELRAVARATAPRHPYYPGAAGRHEAIVRAHPGAEILDPPRAGGIPRALVRVERAATDDPCFTVEAFGGTLAWTELPGAGAAEFLAGATRFCNDTLRGTLGANLIVHPATARELGPALDGALAGLRYGCVAVNTWTGVGFFLSQTSWGAFPGHTPGDIGSGVGHVHNTFLFDRPEKSVVRGPFRPQPRALAHGEFHLSPKPIWSVTHRRAHTVGRRLVAFERRPGPRHLPGIFGAALRG